jgi:hypothetical protein
MGVVLNSLGVTDDDASCNRIFLTLFNPEAFDFRSYLLLVGPFILAVILAACKPASFSYRESYRSIANFVWRRNDGEECRKPLFEEEEEGGGEDDGFK